MLVTHNVQVVYLFVIIRMTLGSCGLSGFFRQAMDSTGCAFPQSGAQFRLAVVLFVAITIIANTKRPSVEAVILERRTFRIRSNAVC